jgi:hypothetical protein
MRKKDVIAYSKIIPYLLPGGIQETTKNINTSIPLLRFELGISPEYEKEYQQ